MAAADAAGDADAHQHGQAPAERDVGVAALDHLAGHVVAEQHDHGHDAVAQGDQHEGAEELGVFSVCALGRLFEHAPPANTRIANTPICIASQSAMMFP